ncbi:MAG: primosomal protein N' [Anaerolineae bacterium]|nr:primosomal protein N' [Anaerolineae bacterium]
MREEISSAGESLPYAIVVVHTPLGRQVAAPEGIEEDREDEGYLTRAFHYLVPQEMRSEARVGQLVWVPFGARYLQGVIVGFAAHSPVEKTRPIDQIVDPEPVLSAAHIQLAYWISEYYLAPLHRVIQSMLPPGITQRAEAVLLSLVEGIPEEATPAQRELLTLLQTRGPLSTSQLAHLGKPKSWRTIARQLIRKGWVLRRMEIRPPKVRPKLASVIRAAPHASLEQVPSRAMKQRALLAYLLERLQGGEGWVPLQQALEDTSTTRGVLRALISKGLVEEEQRQIWRDPLAGRSFVPVVPPRLTPDQERAWQAIAQDLEAPQGRPFLLQGVTGSGKTEIYLRAVQRTLEQGRGAIVLVPEIALTPQTIRRFGARFPTTLAVVHSRLSPGERYDQWRRIRAGELRLVVGSRSAIFAPVRNLGLIVLDEEHEWSYKQAQTPRYHAREVAVQLAHLVGATCILGSATPALESAYRAEQGEYIRLRLPQRIMGHRRTVEEQAALLQREQHRYRPLAPEAEEALYAELPPVKVVDMRQELRAGNTSIFSRALHQALQETLAAGEQAILFLNRRGAATFVMCRDCGYVLRCPRCRVPLAYHSAVNKLVCHHCNYRTPLPSACPNCGSKRIKLFGVGTQRVEALVQKTFPQARVIRWDLDTTGGKMAHEQILERFIRGEADIMIGTQMIAKGLDLPRVTLVGVITADTALNLPDLRAGERTFQLLTQVAGRAGRSILGGRVIIQTYTPEHPAIQAASRHDYEGFYQKELAFRREYGYPPITRLIRLICVQNSERRAKEEAEKLYRFLSLKIVRDGLPDLRLIGPAPAFWLRLRGKWRWHILVCGADPHALLRDVRLPLGWRVDVDPVSLL